MTEAELAKAQENLKFWNSVCVTDPGATKPIQGKDYQGTSPKPHWVVWRLTEKFGPCGIGWGIKVLSERVERINENESQHIAHVQLWYKMPDTGERGEIEQMGQTKFSYLAGKDPNKYLKIDEDAAKKSATDAFVKCASYLGFCGDIFMGLWDDCKYRERADRYWEDRDPASQEPTTKAEREEARRKAAEQAEAAAKKKRELPEAPPKKRPAPAGPISSEQLATIALALEVATKDEEILKQAQEIYWWFDNKAIDQAHAEQVARLAIQRRSELVTADKFPAFRKMVESFGRVKLLPVQDCKVAYNHARTRLNLVEGTEPLNFEGTANPKGAEKNG